MVVVTYHTDPACPWSWGLEPVVRKLMVQFGDGLRWTFVMGGLGRELVTGRPGTPLEPALHAALIEDWLRAAKASGAPLDPLIWADSPLQSTYPACMAVKAAAEQAADGGYRYLRRLREGTMCGRRKLDHTEALVEEARAAGLDVERFRIDLRSNAITESFGADLESTEALADDLEGARPDEAGCSRGIGGAPLPAIAYASEEGTRHAVAGLTSFEVHRAAAVAAGAEPLDLPSPAVDELVQRFGTVTTREVEEVCELPGPRAGAELYRLAEQWKLRAVGCLTGALWQAA